jgi:hypothetical protein
MEDRMQTHPMQQDLPFGRGSHAYLSLEPIGTIFIFVHFSMTLPMDIPIAGFTAMMTLTINHVRLRAG